MFDPDGIENLLPPAPPENSLEEKRCPFCNGFGTYYAGILHGFHTCPVCLGFVHQSDSPPPAPPNRSLEEK